MNIKPAILVSEVVNYKPVREAFVTILNEKGERKIFRAGMIYKNKKFLKKMNQEDSNRVAFLAAVELM